MALINRIARIFKADFNAVLDRMEEPAELLKQAVRDMEEEYADLAQRIRAREQEQAALHERAEVLTHRLADLGRELDLCFASNKEDLARSLVRRKLECQRLLAHLNARHASNERQLDEQRARLAQNLCVLESMKQKAVILAARSPRESAQALDEDDWNARAHAIGEDEIDIAFLREQQARSES